MGTVPQHAAHHAEPSPSLQVGLRTQQVIAHVLQEGVAESRPERQLQLFATTSAVLRAQPVSSKPLRAAALDVASAAGCYIARFLLDPTWEFRGTERPLGGGRTDLLFQSRITDEWLVDEIKTSRGRMDEPALRPQIDRYLEAGDKRWGELFLGVRLCCLAQPRTSRLFVPGSKRSLALVDTQLAGGVA